jgi:hypothetical protein
VRRGLNAGDLDAVMELYEPEARFVAASGETLAGRCTLELLSDVSCPRSDAYHLLESGGALSDNPQVGEAIACGS